MATKPVKVLADLQTKKQILKIDANNNVLFRVSGTLGDGVVLIELPTTASAGISARLYGTASYALNAATASYAENAGSGISSVYTSGSITGSGLIADPIYLTDPLIIGAITSSFLYVPNNLIATNITGNLYGTASYATNAGIDAVTTRNAYNRLRFKETDYFESDGSKLIELPTSSFGANAFPTSSFDYVNVTVFVKEEDRWINDLLSVQKFISSSAIWIELSAPSLDQTNEYKILAVNENPDDYVLI